MDVNASENSPSLEILFEDEHLLVVNKPSGLLVHRGWGNDRVVLVDLVREYLNQVKVFPIHRIDRQTSGVVLFSKCATNAKILGDDFDQGRVQKKYLALVRGCPPPNGVIDHAIPRTEGGERVFAVTGYALVSTVELPIRSVSLVAAYPQTGRLHQVRRHLKHISHPIIGDANYGKGPLNRAIRSQYGLSRLGLHAARLVVCHPVEKQETEWIAPFPKDLEEPLIRMGFKNINNI